jgi:hypothetical protein
MDDASAELGIKLVVSGLRINGLVLCENALEGCRFFSKYNK